MRESESIHIRLSLIRGGLAAAVLIAERCVSEPASLALVHLIGEVEDQVDAIDEAVTKEGTEGKPAP